MSDTIVSSLNRVEGQVRGVRKMYEEGRECEQIAQQISAIQKALTRIGKTMLTDEAANCMKKPNAKKELERVMDSLVKLA